MLIIILRKNKKTLVKNQFVYRLKEYEFIFFRRKEKSVFTKINKYLNQVDVYKDQVIISITELINRCVNERNKALIPELRGDVLEILETADTIPSCFQSIYYEISLQRIEITKELVPL
ncbi:MAG: hypothetical protein OQK82_09095, partial [Candidatus Pacearchaeota archaeon]|nr:hypothetical protein [Candidatus Pacearchaeota archaeon]